MIGASRRKTKGVSMGIPHDRVCNRVLIGSKNPNPARLDPTRRRPDPKKIQLIFTVRGKKRASKKIGYLNGYMLDFQNILAGDRSHMSNLLGYYLARARACTMLFWAIFAPRGVKNSLKIDP